VRAGDAVRNATAESTPQACELTARKRLIARRRRERGQRLLDRARGIKQERYGVIDQRQITYRMIDLRHRLALCAGAFLGSLFVRRFAQHPL
jgi:hypothetical protein